MEKENTSTELINQDDQLIPMKSTELDKNEEYYEHFYREYLSLFKTVIKICNNSPRIFHALIKYSGVLDKENLSEIVVNEKCIFDALTTIRPVSADVLISKLDTPHSSKSDLMDSVRNRDFDMFRNTIRTSSCDLTIIERPCNILFHCINFYTYFKTKGFTKEDYVFDENDFFELLDKGRDTLEAIFNHSIESVVVSSKVANLLDKEINEEENEEKKNARKQNDNLFCSFLEEFVPYIYAYSIPFLSFPERKQIENHLQKMFPDTVYGEMSESTINERMEVIVRKYPQFFPNAPTKDNMELPGDEGRTDYTFQDGILIGMNSAIDQMSLEDNHQVELTDNNEGTSIKNLEQQMDSSNGIEKNEGKLEDCDTDSKEECHTTTRRKKRIKYRVDGLPNKEPAAKGINFQWSKKFKKWYEEHPKAFEDFVKYVAREMAYIPNEQGQVNAFIRTITGRDVPRCDEKVRLINNDRNDATRAMMYLSQCKIINGHYSDIFTHFDVERPQRYKDNKEDTNWMGGYARGVNEDFKKKVEEIFADFLVSQSNKS